MALRRVSIVSTLSKASKKKDKVSFGQNTGKKVDMEDSVAGTFYSKGYRPNRCYLTQQEKMEQRGWSHSPLTQYVRTKPVDELYDSDTDKSVETQSICAFKDAKYASTTEEMIKLLVDKLWDQYDVDLNGELDKDEVKELTKDVMTTVGGQFNKEDFDRTFLEMDNDGNGVIEKEEMVQFLQNLYTS